MIKKIRKKNSKNPVIYLLCRLRIKTLLYSMTVHKYEIILAQQKKSNFSVQQKLIKIHKMVSIRLYID